MIRQWNIELYFFMFFWLVLWSFVNQFLVFIVSDWNMFYSDFGVKVRMKSDTVRTHFTFGLIVNGDIFQTNILTFMILKIFICFYLWVYIYMFLHVCTYTLWMHAVPTEIRNRHQIPWNWSKRWSRVPQCVGAGSWRACALPCWAISLSFVICSFYLNVWLLPDTSESRSNTQVYIHICC